MAGGELTLRRRALAVSDPLVHAGIAALVTAPLVPRAGAGPVLTAVAAGTLIDVDHPVAARSLRLAASLSLPTRPRSHNAFTALGAAAVATAAGGPLYGWAAFAGLASHLLHDSGDASAATPLLWPLAPPRQLGRRAQLAGTVALLAGSWVVSRASRASAAAPRQTG
jgi:hypothetical protein